MKIKVIFLLFLSTIIFIALAACSPIKEDNSKTDSSSFITDELTWESVSRAYRVQGIIETINVQDDKLLSITVKVTKNFAMVNNPVDYDFVDESLGIFFENMNLEQDKQNQIQEGEEIIIAFSQFASQMEQLYMVRYQNGFILKKMEYTKV